MQSGKITRLPLERFFAAVRKVIAIDLAPQHMRESRSLLPFMVAMIDQCTINEQVWAVSEEERAKLEQTVVATEKLANGDLDETWALCLHLLYGTDHGAERVVAADDRLDKVRPKSMATYLVEFATARKRERELADAMTVISVPGDDVGQRVASQYEANPYPRWKNLQTSRPGSLRRAMGQFFRDSELAFMDAPFDVLVAGCGTGRHSSQAASSYGASARVLGIDISLSSLAYAQRMSEELDLRNVAYAQADIAQSPFPVRNGHVQVPKTPGKPNTWVTSRRLCCGCLSCTM